MKIVKIILSFAVLLFAVATEGATVTLTSGTGAVTLQNNDVLTGTGGSETHVTVAAGATVTLRGVDITAIGDKYWSGITCAGSATIVLENSNVVKGGYEEFSGIYFPENCTLTIKGDGALDVRSNGYAAGIGCNGGDNAAPCGNILIQSGTITATGGFAAAGIGGTYGASCGSISIHGGTVTATGGQYAPGIGGSFEATCGNIEIKGGVTTVIATGGEYAPGIGSGAGSECGSITISGGTVIATGSKDAPGIGSGSDAEGIATGGVCGNIIIEEAVTCVTANGGDNALSSIGAGSGGVCGTVMVAGVAQTGGITANPYIYNPCVTNITSTADWDAFASRVNRGVDNYNGKTVTLSADISVTTTVGKWVNASTCYPFSGTFEGGGHSLVANISAGGSAGAPFSTVSGATIRNLNVSGTVAGGYHSSGLVGICAGSSGLDSISNCTVSVAVAVTAYAGGIVGHGGNGKQLLIRNCVFSGSISGFANFAGGILGWCDTLTLTIDNCLSKGSFSPASGGLFHPLTCRRGDNHPVTATADRLYYLCTIAPTVTSANNLIAGAEGVPVNTTRVPFEWSKEVTAADGLTYYAPPVVKLADDTGLVTLQDGDVLMGVGGTDTHIVIAAGATVMFRDITVASIGNDNNHQWAGVTCLGDAVIILKDLNWVMGGHEDYPGIQVPQGSTLAFQGDGRLDTGSRGYAAGIDGAVTVADNLIYVADGKARRIFPGIDIAETESNAAAIARHDGRTETVQMAGRTLYIDGRYNTLCLPFSMNSAEIADSPLAGARIKQLDSTTSSLTEDGVLNLKFIDVSRIEAGRPYVVRWPVDLTIRSAADWNAFASSVSNGTESYEGKRVRLAADISVTTMVGSVANPFKGLFDGCGHVLIFNYTSNSDSEPNVAPFLRVDGATIKNLVVLGSAVSSRTRSSGIVGESVNLSHIVNCRVSSTISGYYYCGGISTGGKVVIENCLFDGKITATTTSGGFVGWSEPTTAISDSLFAPQDGSSLNGGTFYYLSKSGNALLSNSYYTTTLGDIQGESASGMTAEQLHAALGREWELVGSRVLPVMPESDFVISSAADWDTLVEAVALGYTYEGRTVRLAADITVTTMVGDVEKGISFRGTFDGGGHTLTFNYETDKAYCAPFLSAEQATFENLKVAGTIKTSAKFAAGLIAASWGDCTIRNCQVGIEINSLVQGDGTHGGFIAISGDGADSNSDLNRFVNCLFNGRFRGSSTTLCGGFLGWNRAKVSYVSCLFAPALQQFASGGTFNRNVAGSFTRAYYTATLGGAQGINASQMTAAQLLAALGSGWTLNEEGGQSHVVPKMDTSSDSNGSTVDGLMFSGVTVSAETANEKIGLAEYILTIRSSDDWIAFANSVTSGANSYEGWLVTLANDISVSTMAGAGGKSFKGTFDGQGHTITVNLQAGGEGVALFYEINGATIQNLRVSGSVTSTRLRPASFAVFVEGSPSTIKNCWSDATITSSYGDWIDAGGIVARVDNSTTLLVNDCAFHGSINYTSDDGYEGGGMIGWVRDSGYVEFNNCLFAPKSFVRMRADDNSYYFAAANNRDRYKLSNCYYSGAAGNSLLNSEGIQGDALSASALVSSLGGTAWGTYQEGERTYVVPQMRSTVVVAAEFVGSTSPVALGSGYRSTLVIADDGTLAVPEAGTTVNSCRAFFRLKNLPAGSEVTRYELDLGDKTVTGPLDIPTASGYALWASDNGIAGAAEETDANGVANVFRYAFDRPTGAFADPALLSIAIEGGQVVIYTPPLVNTEGYTFSIIATDALGGADDATYPLDPSGRTPIPAANKPARFFRLRAVATD